MPPSPPDAPETSPDAASTPDTGPPLPPDRRGLLALELGVIFFVGPSVYTLLNPGPGWLFPLIWILGAYALVILLRDSTFPKRQLWNFAGGKPILRHMLLRFLILGAGMALAVVAADRWYFGEPLLFELAKRNPGLLAMIMIFYPIFSVYPQEVAFRTFFFHRYRHLLPGKWLMIGVGAAAFSWAHIVFQNGLALVMCLVAGVLFGQTFWRSRSTAAVWLEHALYGCLIFVIGLGRFFYAGAVGQH